MKNRIRFLFVSIATAIVMTACATNKGGDTKSIQGTWTIADAQLGGAPFPAQAAKSIVLKIDGGKYEVKSEGIDKGTYTMDATAEPRTLDIYGTEGPNAGKHYRCIYELHGDALKVCYQLGDGPRPTEFKSPKGTQIFLVTYQRRTD